ncbi:MAG: DUF1232 domain-containing protein [Planctomycetes bacterium]|nr:DUF1232 domain-containing protein [Planctomycetota bacterium]
MTDESSDRLRQYSSDASANDAQRIGRDLAGMKRGPVARVWADVSALWAMIRDPNAAWSAKAIAIGALLYLVSPIDGVPDLIPIAGLIDDVGVIAAAVGSLSYQLREYRRTNG